MSKNSIKEIKEVKDIDLDLVWDPPWDKSMMSEAAKLGIKLMTNSIIKNDNAANKLKK